MATTGSALLSKSELYARLPLSEETTRIIKLPPRGQLNEFSCELQVVPLNHVYEALSYAWGTVYSNDLIFVTENLLVALRNLQDTADGDARYIWIDAISLNQDDEHEREREILRMSHIFERAERVIVWLGEATPESDNALDHFNGLPDDCFPLPGDDFPFPRLLQDWEPNRQVLQEAIMAHDLQVCCGSKIIPWARFAWTAWTMRYHRLELLRDEDLRVSMEWETICWDSIRMIAELRHSVRLTGEMTFPPHKDTLMSISSP